ncbi:MAG: metallophosphoesterase [Archaeoglobales archaeon]|nr:metallophosphoesterase [Archaeoglobales archaeon]
MKLTPEKACIVKDTAILADLHLGIENFLQEKGIAIPRIQIKEVKSGIKNIIEKYNVNRLIIAGDLKHEFSRNMPYEWEDVKELVEFILDLGIKLEIVRGNHDNYLASILSAYDVKLKDFVVVGDFYITHGHKELEFDKMIIGHEHPCIKIRVRGANYSFPSYLLADNKILVLPAFSPLVPGSDVMQGEFLSPILKKAKKIEIYAIEDEVVYLGTIEDLKSTLREL